MLRLQNISKSFSGLQALKNVSIEFDKGNVHALCGENGAGKSTLMNIIVGNLQPDEGQIIWKDQHLRLPDIRFAQDLGIGIVYQERSLVDSLTVAENIFPNAQTISKWQFINYGLLFKRTQQLLDELHMDTISPKRLVTSLSPEEKQMVEIAKALSKHPSLLILDEPTASLTTKETQTLFDIIRRLKGDGVAVIYISHRMDEIKEIADKVSVLKDGQYQGTMHAATASTEQLIQMMVGRELTNMASQSYIQNETKLQVENLNGDGFKDVSFSIRKGEVFGFAGLLGSGRTEVARAIFGDYDRISGTIKKDGIDINPTHPSEGVDAGIAYLPNDRKLLGLFLERSVSENIASTQLQKGWYRKGAIKSESESYQQQLNIRTPSVLQAVRKLSGGNQQKVVLAKWLATKPDLLIVNEPTHGVDVGAKAEIYRLIKRLAEEGKSILLISSELPELLLLCDRLAVMYQGEIKAILSGEEATEEKITALASGV